MNRTLDDGGLAPGQTIGAYVIVRTLGAGAFGAVYEARKHPLNKRIALKILHSDKAHEPATVARFLQEASAAASLKHPHIVEVDDVGAFGAAPFLAMEFLEGESLGQCLTRVGRLSVPQALDLLLPICSALDAVHARGIVHRDIKPDNVFLWRSTATQVHPKLLDFGIAKVREGAVDLSLTRAGAILGTPLYMAPEQWGGSQHATAQADQWSLAVVLFQCLTGRLPFEADTPNALMLCVSTAPPTPLRAFDPSLPPALDAALARAFEKHPSRRYASVRELARALLPFADPSTRARWFADFGSVANTVALQGPPPSLPSPRWPKVLLIASGALCALAVTTAVSFYLLDAVDPPRPAPPRPSAPSAPLVVPPAPAVIAPAPLPPPPPPPLRCPEGMALIPGGTFRMGAMASIGLPDEHPQHLVRLRPYCLDRMEVTVGQYLACAQSGACVRAPTLVEAAGIVGSGRAIVSRNCNGQRPDRLDHPINCVDWTQATAYCAWLRRALPTEAQWEYAARGEDGRQYPWGDLPPSAQRVNGCGGECRAFWRRLGVPTMPPYTDDDGFATTAPVGRFPLGASPFGLLDMAGNVWEWVADGYSGYPASAEATDGDVAVGVVAAGSPRMYRGGGWFTGGETGLRATHRLHQPPTYRFFDLGLRCASAPLAP